jgi:hypothetical protein
LLAKCQQNLGSDDVVGTHTKERAMMVLRPAKAMVRLASERNAYELVG